MAGNHRKGARAERRIAHELGGRRVGNTGQATPDVIAGRNGWLIAEVKERAKLPAWIGRALAQARSAAGPSQLGIAVLHETGSAYRDALVVMTLADFRDWYAGPGDDLPT